MSSFRNESERWLSSGEVAEIFGVDPKTVGRWEAAGRLNAQRTLGGHRRFSEAEVYRLLWGGGAEEVLGEGGLTISDQSG